MTRPNLGLRLLLVVCGSLAVGGCAKPPKVTKGRFNTSYTVTIQRGCTQVVVLTSGPARFIQKDYWMDHPMGQRPDTEAAVTTPAGKYIITNRNLGKPGVFINGTYYPDPIPCFGQTITIGPSGAITVKLASPPPRCSRRDVSTCFKRESDTRSRGERRAG